MKITENKNNATLSKIRITLLVLAVCGVAGCLAIFALNPVRESIITIAERIILRRNISHGKWNGRLSQYAVITLVPLLAVFAASIKHKCFAAVVTKAIKVFDSIRELFSNKLFVRVCAALVCTVLAAGAVFYFKYKGVWPDTPLHNEILRAHKNNDIDIVMLPDFEAQKVPAMFFFGMENRRKLVFKDNMLSDFKTGEVIASFDGAKTKIEPHRYAVTTGEHLIIEDEGGVFIDGIVVSGTEEQITIPDFDGYRYPIIMKILYQEIMFAIIDGTPYARLFDYFHNEKGEPGGIVWYRDIAYIGLFLQKMERADLLTGFIQNINRMYDANRDVKEPDNLGQILYLQSLLEKPDSALVNDIIAEARRIRDADGNLTGTTDGAPSAAYQNGWLIYGLNALGMSDVAREFNSHSLIDNNGYSHLLWFTLPDRVTPHSKKRTSLILRTDWKAKYTNIAGQPYPYINIGMQHFNMRMGRDYKNPVLTQIVYPITWGDGTRPHIWHDAELFLYLMELKNEP